ncbi:hypothetical protein GGTG_03772 [Gaeumannomyces tritici R3-111a-1]|uniref:Uncharacterized protein n=1 Tax=Gaeumannomyces tritici (strain R3-111a-1) TaxID=644352 RepID=J3NR67_GAET3|nr:hypothetical protein GGTG_03772 [Gaeumannomyces tritici R3-111a-1]EJT78673.1 hypothetical protein GGTG_03772 [Gaeumannomyces tritici R3-111a-1]
MASSAPKGWATTPGHSARPEVNDDRSHRGRRAAQREPEPERGRTLQRGRAAARQELRVYWHNRGSDRVYVRARDNDDDGDDEGDPGVFVGVDETLRCDAADYLRGLADFLGDTRGSCRLHLLTCTEGSVDVVVDTRLDLPTVVSIMRRCAVPRSEHADLDRGRS